MNITCTKCNIPKPQSSFSKNGNYYRKNCKPCSNKSNRHNYRNKRVISTIGYDQHQMIKDILKLHVPSGTIDVDVCYSTGKFYEKSGITPPVHKFDIRPQADGVIEADCQDLSEHLEAESVDCVMFDPPFLMSSPSKNKKDNDNSNLIHKRFSSFKSPKSLWGFYSNSLKEFHRVLKPKGVLIFKCQDSVNSGKQYFSSNYIINESESIGYYVKDKFVLLAKMRMISGKIKTQQHARKFHSYFIVFLKK